MTWVWAVKSAAESLGSRQDERDAFLVFFLAAINAEGHVACGMRHAFDSCSSSNGLAISIGWLLMPPLGT